MQRVNTISILHVVFLSMTVIGLKNHVTILPPILKTAGRDGWASILVSATLIIPWLFLVVAIHKKTRQKRLMDVISEKIGQKAARVCAYFFSFFLLVLAAFTMRETLQWMATTFLPKTPQLLLLVIYLVLCILLVSTNIQTIVIVNIIVLFGVVVFGFFVGITNIQVKNYELLRPFFEHGALPVFKSAVYPASGYAELLIFLFLQHQIRGALRMRHFLIMLGLLVMLTLGPLIGSITEFGPTEGAKQRFPAYEEWGLVTIGRFFEHLDFFSIYQWLTGAFIRVGLFLYIVVDLLNLTEKRKRIWETVAPAFFFISLALFLMNDQLFIRWKGSYFLPATFLIFFLISLFLVVIVNKSNKRTKSVQSK